MEDIKFQLAYDLDWTPFQELHRVHKQCVWDVAQLFARNMLRAQSLIQLLPAVVSIAMRYADADVMATYHLTKGRFNFTKEEEEDPEKMKIFRATVEAETAIHEKRFRDDLELARKEDERSVNNVAYILRLYEGQPLEAGVWSLLESVIRTGWTAMETMAEYLFVRVTDTFPQCFQGIVWENNEPKFRSRTGIKKAYEKAFGGFNEKIRECIYSDAFDALGLLRNVLVHSAGIADTDFMDGVARNSLLSMYSSQRLGSPVKVDGEVIKTVLEPAVRMGCDLVLAVDTWVSLCTRTQDERLPSA